MIKYKDVLKKRLTNKGYKLTKQRLVILDVLLKYKDKHLNTKEIFKLVKENNQNIGMATVYRTIQIFEEVGIVYGEYFGDESVRYEIARKNEGHRHHHLICIECGSIEECYDDLLESVEEEIYKRRQFETIDHIVEMYGYCKNCLSKKVKK